MDSVFSAFTQRPMPLGAYSRLCSKDWAWLVYEQEGVISTLIGKTLKLVNQSTYVGSNISFTDTHKESIDCYREVVSDKIKRDFFQKMAVSVLPYGYTTCILMKSMLKMLDENYSRTLRAVLNKSRKQHPTKQQLQGHFLPISQTIK